jgi:hypothetical protein
MSFRITGLSPELFRPLFGLSDDALAVRGVERVRIATPNSAPCRISLEDAAPGESVLLLNFEHQPADTPYRARHAIFVREEPVDVFNAVDVVPDALRRRPLSVRAFGADHRMVDADLVDGASLEGLLESYLARDVIVYVQIHYAKRGCYAARAERA